LNCTTDEAICIPTLGNSLCAKPKIDAAYYRRAPNSVTGLGFDVEDLLDVGILNPEMLSLTLTHNAPIRFYNPISFQSCLIKYGDTTCTSCSICNVDKGFKFDCSNITVIDVGGLEINLPKTNACIGF
jgi:hypothetical protein